MTKIQQEIQTIVDLLKYHDDRIKKVEDEMWEIEKKVKNDNSLPEDLRKSFVSYVEKREDEIEKKYK